MALCDHGGLFNAVWNSVGDSVLIFIRWLLKVFKKEHELVNRYTRSHPHFFWYVGIDALLSVALIVAGYHFFAQNSASQMLKHSGVVAMSSGELINHLKKENVDTFWLGPVSGYQYTLNHKLPGIADLFYIRNGSDPSSPNQYLFEVKTYVSQSVWDAHTHSLLATANTTTIVISKNISIRINESSMKGVIATYSDTPEIVAIRYPIRQTLQDMIKNVESLRLVG